MSPARRPLAPGSVRRAAALSLGRLITDAALVLEDHDEAVTVCGREAHGSRELLAQLSRVDGRDGPAIAADLMPAGDPDSEALMDAADLRHTTWVVAQQLGGDLQLTPGAADFAQACTARHLMTGAWVGAGARVLTRECTPAAVRVRAAHGHVLLGLDVTGGQWRVGVLDDPDLHATWITATTAHAQLSAPPFTLSVRPVTRASDALGALVRAARTLRP